MKFGNPVSSVTVAGGSVSISGNVGINGTPEVAFAAGATLGVNSLPASNVFATASQALTINTTNNIATGSIIPAVVGTRYLVISLLLSPFYCTNQYSGACNLGIVRTDGPTLLSVRAVNSVGPSGSLSNVTYNDAIDLNNLILPDNVGLNYNLGNSGYLSFTLFYVPISSVSTNLTNPSVIGTTL